MSAGEQPFLFADPSSSWVPIRDGNPTAMSLFLRHYSARPTPRREFQFIGPGEKMVLLTADARAVFVWRRDRFTLNGQTGINCAVFRNEGSNAGRSSELIQEAKRLAWERWPGERLYTYVDPKRVRHKRDPGRCFLRAGFHYCGITKKRKRLILECLPEVA